MRWMLGPWGTRSAIYTQVEASLGDGELEWTEETRTRVGEVFETLHRHWLPSYYEEHMERRQDYVRRYAGWLTEQLASYPEGVQQLQAQVAETRAGLEERERETGELYLARLSPAVEGEWSGAILEVEVDVAATLLEAHPEASAGQLETSLKSSPVLVTDATNSLEFPRLDCAQAHAALTALLVVPPIVPSLEPRGFLLVILLLIFCGAGAFHFRRAS